MSVISMVVFGWSVTRTPNWWDAQQNTKACVVQSRTENKDRECFTNEGIIVQNTIGDDICQTNAKLVGHSTGGSQTLTSISFTYPWSPLLNLPVFDDVHPISTWPVDRDEEYNHMWRILELFVLSWECSGLQSPNKQPELPEWAQLSVRIRSR